MKKISDKVKVGIVAVVVAVAGFVVTSQVIGRRSAPTVAASGIQVKLGPNKAMPDTITVKVGETVQFNSADGKKHDISIGQGGHEHEHTSAYQSGEFGADEAWRVQFKEPGTYSFHDHYNPEINILVVAYEPSTP